LTEIGLLARLTHKKEDNAALLENRLAMAGRRSSPRIHNPAVKDRVEAIASQPLRRISEFKARRPKQNARLNLPLLPTTTIGSFPKTDEVRAARARFKKGQLSATEYDRFLEEHTRQAVRWQEEVGLDVLVHGEFERNDMVEYFGEQLAGFAF